MFLYCLANPRRPSKVSSSHIRFANFGRGQSSSGSCHCVDSLPVALIESIRIHFNQMQKSYRLLSAALSRKWNYTEALIRSYEYMERTDPSFVVGTRSVLAIYCILKKVPLLPLRLVCVACPNPADVSYLYSFQMKLLMQQYKLKEKTITYHTI